MLSLGGALPPGSHLVYRVGHPVCTIASPAGGKVKRPNLAASISVFWIGLIIIVPAALLGGRLITEAANGANTMKEKAASGEWRRAMEDQGALRPFVEWIDQINLPDVIGTVASWLATASASLVRGGLLQLVTVLLTFYLLFFFLRDREAVLDWLREISPLSEEEMNRLMVRIADTVMATLYGTVAVATLQGVSGDLSSGSWDCLRRCSGASSWASWPLFRYSVRSSSGFRLQYFLRSRAAGRKP